MEACGCYCAAGPPPQPHRHQLRPTGLCGFRLGATVVCQNPLGVSLPSVHLDGLLILTNITLGLFKLCFFPLRKINTQHEWEAGSTPTAVW